MEKVKLIECSPHPKKTGRMKKSVREGLAFEAKVQEALKGMFPQAEHFPSQWLSFEFDGKIRHAQPDHYIKLRKGLLIFEVKLRHTPRSCAQLLRYGELLHQVYPHLPIFLIEVFKYQDWVDYPHTTYVLEGEPNQWKLNQNSIGLLNLYL